MPKRIRILRGESTKYYESPGLTVTLDAASVASMIGKAVAEYHREAIRSGDKASGGPQRPLGPQERSRAARGKREGERGMGSKGAFPDSIKSTKGRGDLRAQATVAASDFFDDWQQREKSRGVEYFDTDGDVDALVESIVDHELKRQGFQ